MAISRERLEELIEQGATIYHYEYGKVFFDRESQLYKTQLLASTEDWGYCDILKMINPNAIKIEIDSSYKLMPFGSLFESKEELDWLDEFGKITRTETLNLPTWEQVQTMELKNNEMIVTYTLPQKIWENLDIDNIERYIRINRAINILLCMDENGFWKPFPYTKDGYLSACRLAKKLFLGEK